MPEIGGLTPSGIEPLTIECPSGYLPRETRLALPTTGRFRSIAALTAAFCEPMARTAFGFAQASSSSERAEPAIDFSKSDVVVHAYDASAGTPVLYRRGEELWLQVEVDDCRGNAPTLAGLAFVIPKHQRVAEQTCSQACR
jgi:hypothetical protein